MNERKAKYVSIGLFALLICALLWTVASASPREAVPTRHTPQNGVVAVEGHDVEVCFPKRLWNDGTVPQENRPCYLVGVPAEDGSGRLNLGTEGYEQAVCTVPNVAEEHGQFSIPCRRVR